MRLAGGLSGLFPPSASARGQYGSQRFEIMKKNAMNVCCHRAAGALLLSALLAGCAKEKVGWDHGLEVGAVVASNADAVDAGREVLEAGGNAVDAAIAVAFALHVAEPFASGIGGGGFMLVLPAGGEPQFLDYRELAPAAARPDMFVDATADQINFSGKSVAVPGHLRGMQLAHRQYGSKPMAELLAPAIRLAAEGVTASAAMASALERNWGGLVDDPELSSIFLEEGISPYSEGQRIVQSNMAGLLTRLAEQGLDSFYEGEVAEAIVAAVVRGGGDMTIDDLRAYREARISKPIIGSWGPYTVITSPSPSAGGAGLIQLLNVWRHYPGEVHAQPDLDESRYLALAMGAMFEDIIRHAGDSRFVNVPVAELIDPEYVRAIAARILAGELTPGGQSTEGGSTTSFITADRHGNVVVATHTINFLFGSRIGVPGLGLILNNQMSDFSTDPQSPNAPEPGKIPLSSMTPTLFVKDGAPVLAVASPGARRIITSVAQVALNYIERGNSIADAVEAPRFHFEGGKLRVEERFGDEQIEAFRKLGFDVFTGGVGSVTALGWRDGKAAGHDDSRRKGAMFVK